MATMPFLFLFLFLSSSYAQTSSNRVRCDDGSFSCPANNTCCCVYRVSRDAACYAWACCPHPNGICCGRETCCPHDHPVCNIAARTCSVSKGSPVGVIPAQPIRGMSSS